MTRKRKINTKRKREIHIDIHPRCVFSSTFSVFQLNKERKTRQVCDCRLSVRRLGLQVHLVAFDAEFHYRHGLGKSFAILLTSFEFVQSRDGLLLVISLQIQEDSGVHCGEQDGVIYLLIGVFNSGNRSHDVVFVGRPGYTSSWTFIVVVAIIVILPSERSIDGSVTDFLAVSLRTCFWQTGDRHRHCDSSVCRWKKSAA